MARTIEQWTEILKDLSAHNAAQRILHDLTAYPSNGSRQYTNHIHSDMDQLANALMAFRKIIFAGYGEFNEAAQYVKCFECGNYPEDCKCST